MATLKIVPKKGSDLKIVSWGAVPQCEGPICPAKSSCPLTTQPSYSNKKCSVVQEYIQEVERSIRADSRFKKLETMDIARIGLHLAPLYILLCRLQLESMSVNRAVTMTDNGSFVSHPIFREIRDTMKTISGEWKNLGFARLPIIVDVGNVMSSIHGNPDYYDSLSDESETPT